MSCLVIGYKAGGQLGRFIGVPLVRDASGLLHEGGRTRSTTSRGDGSMPERESGTSTLTIMRSGTAWRTSSLWMTCRQRVVPESGGDGSTRMAEAILAPEALSVFLGADARTESTLP